MAGRIFYPSVFNLPVAPTAPVTVPRGGASLFPDRTACGRARQQTQGEFLPPGRFTTTVAQTNTTQGGVVLAPERTRRRAPQQPDGVVLPPGRFSTTSAPKWGWEIAAPRARFRRAPWQPHGEYRPPGSFSGSSPAPGTGVAVCVVGTDGSVTYMGGADRSVTTITANLDC